MLFRRGNTQREAFERLVESVFPSVYGTALRLTKDRDEASDLTQEAVVRAFEAFDRFDGRSFKAWILRILTNLYINRYRKRQREGNTASLDDDEIYAEPTNPEEESPDRILLDNLLGKEVEEALANIPDVFRMAVVLSDIEGLSYEEIAQATDVPVGTVRSRLARGRALLKKQLEAFAIEQGYIKR